MIHHGDCVEVMAGMDPESVDAIVTDPPYGLEFMGKEWDKLDAGLPQENVWKGRRGKGGSSFAKEPNVAFAGTVRGPSFGGGQQGFKTCGKRAFSGSPCQCPEPTWVIEYNQTAPSASLRMGRWHQQWAEAAYRVAKPSAYLLAFGGTRTVHRMTVALEDAGWIIRDMLVWGYASGFPKSKASLKPAWEPIVMARKPGPLRMLAIDECRIGLPEDKRAAGSRSYQRSEPGGRGEAEYQLAPHDGLGRWPANIVLTDPIFDGGIEGVVGGGETTLAPRVASPFKARGVLMRETQAEQGYRPDGDEYPSEAEYRGRAIEGYGDSGTYSRFFLIPKAARSDREPVLGGLPVQVVGPTGGYMGSEERPDERPGRVKHERSATERQNVHPTVKPTDLMRHLVRLVTPTGGVVLDPFLGSGTTALAAEMEGFDWIGIEREAEYVAIAEARLNGTQRGLGLDIA